MGVQLNIKDPATVKLARELAGRSGRTVTDTIRSALEQEKRREDAEIEERVAEILALSEDLSQYLDPAWRGKTSKEIMDSIYDEDGLPA
jgi:antitoxin VapB